MSRRRLAALLCVALVVVLAIAALAPGLVARATERALGARGVSASVSARGRTLELRDLRAELRGATLACDHIVVRVGVVASLAARAPIARAVDAGNCSVGGHLERPTEPADPTGEGRDRRPAVKVQELSVVRMDVDARAAGVHVRGSLDHLHARRADGTASAAWNGSLPVPWATGVHAHVDADAIVLAFDTPVERSGWSLQPRVLAVAAGGTVRADGIRISGPGGVEAEVAEASFANGTVTVRGLRGRLPEPERAPTEGSGTSTEMAVTDPRVPPTDDDGDPSRRPAAYATTALRMTSSLPRRHGDARDRLADALEQLPVAIEARDAVVEGVPICGTVTVARAHADTTGATADLACGEWRLTAAIPRDATAPATFTMAGYDLAALPGDTGGRMDVEAQVVPEPDGVRATADLRVTDARLEHPAIAPVPVAEIDATVRLEIAVRAPPASDGGMDGRTSVAMTLSGALDGVGLDGTFSATPYEETWRLDAEAGVTDPTPCAMMWEALPDGLVPNLRRAGVTFAGSARPRMRASYVAGDPESFDVRQDGFMGDCLIEYIGAPYDVRELLRDDFVHEIPPDEAGEAEVRDEDPPEPIRVGPGTPGWVPLDAMPSYVPALMWLSEEVAFFDNPGFSLMLMRRAVRVDLREGRYVYGGSTVSQQLVKNLYFTRDKTLARKLEEAIVVWAMEQWVPKSRILELYVNCIEFGPDVWGISSATRHYFGLDPWAVTPLEAGYLAALKPAPWLGERYRARGSTPDTGWWPERLQELLQRLVDEGPYVDQAEVEHYAPYVVTFPAGPEDAPRPWARVARPKGARLESLAAARERLGLAMERRPRP